MYLVRNLLGGDVSPQPNTTAATQQTTIDGSPGLDSSTSSDEEYFTDEGPEEHMPTPLNFVQPLQPFGADASSSPRSDSSGEQSYEMVDAHDGVGQGEQKVSTALIEGICDALESLDHSSVGECLEKLLSLTPPASACLHISRTSPTNSPDHTDTETPDPSTATPTVVASTAKPIPGTRKETELESRLRMVIRRVLQRQMFLQAEVDRLRAATAPVYTLPHTDDSFVHQSSAETTPSAFSTPVASDVATDSTTEQQTTSAESFSSTYNGTSHTPMSVSLISEDFSETSTGISEISSKSPPKNRPILIAPCCLQECTRVARAVMQGDLTQRIHCGCASEGLADLMKVMNEMVDRLHLFTTSVVHFARENNVLGRLGVQMDVEPHKGDWKVIICALNSVSYNHSEQVLKRMHVMGNPI
jgi:hypothetical protein